MKKTYITLKDIENEIVPVEAYIADMKYQEHLDKINNVDHDIDYNSI